MLDILIICNNLDNNLALEDVLDQKYPNIRYENIFFNERSTKVSLNPKTGETIISQFGKLIELNSKVYIYYPSYLDIESTSLFLPTGEPEYYPYIYRQWQVITEYLEFFLENLGKWVNKPSKLKLAKNKALQLKLANEQGLSVPETVITNDLDVINNLFAKTLMEVGVHKSISESGVINDELISRTSLFKAEEINQEDSGIELAPACFQEFINSEIELRTYVIGNRAITITIEPQDKYAIPDIRSQPKKEHLFSLSSNFEAYEKSLVSLVHTLGLNYAAVDSIVANQQIFFLELNPNGTWDWLPEKLQTVVRESYYDYILELLDQK